MIQNWSSDLELRDLNNVSLQGLRTEFMYGWALTFFVLASVAAYLGFFGLAGLAAEFVKLLFVVFFVLLAGTSLLGLIQDEPPI